VARRYIILIKVFTWLLCLGPLGVLVWKAFHLGSYAGFWDYDLGADPLSVITLTTGHWTLILLLTTLAVTPARRITGWNWLIRFRRLIGLFAFFYGCLHLTTYLWFDKFFVVSDIVKDIGKRPFITVGFTAWVLMLPLALTSTAASIRRLGGKRWQALHRLIYFSALAGVIHFWWLVKKDIRRPEKYALVLTILLLFRILLWTWPKVKEWRKSRTQTIAEPSRKYEAVS
jgi:sulfoxide reductase heme-binding subunit YedZ